LNSGGPAAVAVGVVKAVMLMAAFVGWLVGVGQLVWLFIGFSVS